MNKLLLPTVWLIIVAAVCTKPAHATECWQREAADKIAAPAGKTLVPSGYICVDHLGTYAEVISGDGPHELVIPHRGLRGSDYVRPRIVARPSWRVPELKSAGLLREPQVDQRLAKR